VAGLVAAIPTVYPRALHQRCWVHKTRNILEQVRKRDYDKVKRERPGDLVAQITTWSLALIQMHTTQDRELPHVTSLATHLIAIFLAGQFHGRTSIDCGNAREELRTRV